MNYWAPLNETDDEDKLTLAIAKTPAHHTQVEKEFQHNFRQWLHRRCGVKIQHRHRTSGMVLDSGATSHFVRQSDNLPSMGESNMSVRLPNGDSIHASHTVNLPYSALSNAARHAHILPHFTTHSLVSVPKLADAGYTAVFHPGKQGVTIHGTNTVSIHQRCKPVLQGWQDENGLWQLGYDSNASIMSRQIKE